jgi:DNA-binding response OmpR family regulator
VDAGTQALARSVAAHPSATRRRRLVLHVSGDQGNRILLSRIAKRWEGLRLLVVDGARAGLALAAARRPDLLVVDAHLHDAGGEETVARLRQELRPQDVPIIVLGDDPAPSARARFVWAGAGAYVTTPLDIAEIDRTVSELLEVAALR